MVGNGGSYPGVGLWGSVMRMVALHTSLSLDRSHALSRDASRMFWKPCAHVRTALRAELLSGYGIERLCRRVDRRVLFTDVCLPGIRLRDSIHSVDCC